jgi:tRNA(fMet)-specific endonuclease VapC
VKYLLASNTCIGWLRQSEPKVVSRIQAENSADIYLCSVVLGELIYGVFHSGPAHQAANGARIVLLRQRFVSVPFDDRAAEEYGQLRAQLKALGQLIGPNDLMIAAIALANGLILVTHNTTEFGRVPRLTVEDWQ